MTYDRFIKYILIEIILIDSDACHLDGDGHPVGELPGILRRLEPIPTDLGGDMQITHNGLRLASNEPVGETFSNCLDLCSEVGKFFVDIKDNIMPLSATLWGEGVDPNGGE